MDIKIKDLTGKSPSDVAREAVKLLLARKAIGTKLFSVVDTTVIADYYIIASARSTTHMKALADELAEKLKEAGVAPSHIEGRDGGEWILVDFDNVIVHIFSRDARDFYNLERLCKEPMDIADIEAELDAEMNVEDSEDD